MMCLASKVCQKNGTGIFKIFLRGIIGMALIMCCLFAHVLNLQKFL